MEPYSRGLLGYSALCCRNSFMYEVYTVDMQIALFATLVSFRISFTTESYNTNSLLSNYIGTECYTNTEQLYTDARFVISGLLYA